MVSSLGSTHFLQFCIQWSSIALLYYDYALTFRMEVEYIWRQKFRFSSVLYVWCRYGLVANIIYLLTIANKITLSVCLSLRALMTFTIVRCDAGYRISGAFSVLGRAAVVIVWGARTYAVFARSRLVLTFFGTIGLMIIILDVIHVPTTTLNVGGSWRNQRKGFMYLLLEQGTLYFCVVTGFTIASLALNVQIPGGFLQRLLNAYTLPLSGLMTARFLLHLRKWESAHTGFQSEGQRQDSEETTTMDFTSNPNDRAGRSTIASYIDEFGEDPVRRARDRGGLGFNMNLDDMRKESLPQ
ncbi:hypothetical protein LshimejAT787_0606080 [Lyophyllum shimeji]|uniref:DUF6533 domain-containing protein n=1 Tax=Lyophyllum shimeji TaxID=47721 RepID=A0A9P3UQP6_LYOSH|nr:hypothetical protein LshimejAT787_0606080 [Lyophyllum shimeji]